MKPSLLLLTTLFITSCAISKNIKEANANNLKTGERIARMMLKEFSPKSTFDYPEVKLGTCCGGYANYKNKAIELRPYEMLDNKVIEFINITDTPSGLSSYDFYKCFTFQHMVGHYAAHILQDEKKIELTKVNFFNYETQANALASEFFLSRESEDYGAFILHVEAIHKKCIEDFKAQKKALPDIVNNNYFKSKDLITEWYANTYSILEGYNMAKANDLEGIFKASF